MVYLVNYSTGNSIHDEQRRVASIHAKDFAEAGTRAEQLATRRGGVVTSITRKESVFTKGASK